VAAGESHGKIVINLQAINKEGTRRVELNREFVKNDKFLLMV
jgi:hypothetical protein